MQRSLNCFPLCSSHLAKLSTAGFETVEDVRGVGVVELSKEANLSHSEALEILRVVKGTQTDSSISSARKDSPGHVSPALSSRAAGNEIRGRSALELLRSEQELGHVVTFSSQVDSMLGGGVPLRKITEICGAPGVGKTQFSMQLAVDVRIPELFGGVGGEAVYIDTEGSFVVERVVDIALAAVGHIKNVAESNRDDEMVAASNLFTLEAILSGIHYYRCHNYIELVALVNILPDILSQHTKVRLILIDSVASPFRYGFHDMGLRNRILSGLSQNLIQLAVTSNIAVVLTNQMTTKLNSKHGGSNTSELVPALGESWGHVSTIRIILFWSSGGRCAMLYKSPSRKAETVQYQITQDGIRDVVLEPAISQDHTLTQYASISNSQLEELEDVSNCYEFDENDEFPFSDSPPFDTGTHLDREGRDCLNPEHQRQWTGFQTSSSSLLEPDRKRSVKRKCSDQLEYETSSVLAQVVGQREPSSKRPHPE